MTSENMIRSQWKEDLAKEKRYRHELFSLTRMKWETYSLCIGTDSTSFKSDNPTCYASIPSQFVSTTLQNFL